MKNGNGRAFTVGIGAILMAALKTLPVGVLSVFLIPMCTDLGASIGELSFMFSAIAVGAMLISLVIGKLFKALPLKLLIVIGGISATAFLLTVSFSHSLTPVIITGIAFGFLGNLAGQPMANIVISNWFAKSRSTMMSCVMVANTAFTAIAISLLANLIAKFGYRPVALWFGIIIGAVIVLLGLFVIVPSPEKVGLKPYGYVEAPAGAEAQAAAAVGQQYGFSVSSGKAVKTAAFWGVMLVCFFSGCVIQVYGSQGSAFFQSIGLSATDAATALSVGTIAGALWNLVYGRVSDKKGPKIATYINCTLATVVYLTIFLWKGWVGAIVCAIAFNGVSALSIFGPTILPNLFGYQDVASMIGFSTAATGLGAVVGPTLAGQLYDATGSYNVPFVVAGVMMAVSLVIVTWLGRKKTAENIQKKFQTQ